MYTKNPDTQQMQEIVEAQEKTKIDKEKFLCTMVNKFIEFSIFTESHMGH